jgi:hypothetical protein
MVSKYPSEVFDDFDRLAACRLRSVLFVASTGSSNPLTPSSLAAYQGGLLLLGAPR